MHTESMYKRLARVRAPRSAGVAVSCLGVALAVAALDDVSTGVEPDFLGEQVMAPLAAVWFLGGSVRLWKRRLHPRPRSGMRLPQGARP